MDFHHLHRYTFLPTDFLQPTPTSVPAFSSADESHSIATSSTTSFVLESYPTRSFIGENQAFAQARKRHYDSGELHHLAVHSVASELPAYWETKSDNIWQRCLKASKSDSHLLHLSRPLPPRQVLEEYSLGSGNPYAAPEKRPFNEPLP